MQKDTVVFELIRKELERQRHGIELIASENFTSLQVMQAMGTVLTNKYAEGYPGRRYYGGCEIVDKVEQLAIDRLKEIFGCAYANVQPHSGAQANAAMMLAILQPGDKILGLDLSMGGHLTHGSPVNFSGKLYHPVFYGVKKEDGRVDYDSMEAVAKKEKPKLIICGASAYSRRIRAVRQPTAVRRGPGQPGLLQERGRLGTVTQLVDGERPPVAARLKGTVTFAVVTPEPMGYS